MQVLNATTKVKSIMTDRGNLITIKPGELSELIIASRNMIVSAMNLGEPKDIGIIIKGSYEMDVAKNITGAVPYLYTDEDEAKSKLLDPSIDYVGTLNASKVNMVNEEIIKKKDEEIEKLKTEVSDITSKLQDAVSSNGIKAELEKRISDLEKLFKDVQTERDRLRTQLKDSQDQVEQLTKKSNELRETLGSKMQDLTGSSNMINKLTEEIENLKSELKNKKSDSSKEIDQLNDTIAEKDEQINKLKDNLKDSAETIESMKSEFNSACEKFKITKDDKGNWIQVED